MLHPCVPFLKAKQGTLPRTCVPGHCPAEVILTRMLQSRHMILLWRAAVALLTMKLQL